MNEKTENQRKFSEKFKAQFGIELDWNKYYITRGRGWDKGGGTFGACIYIADESPNKPKNGEGRIYPYYFNGPIARFLPKKYHFYILKETVDKDYRTPELFLAWYDKDGKEVVE